jgi:hypothetical protein
MIIGSRVNSVLYVDGDVSVEQGTVPKRNGNW